MTATATSRVFTEKDQANFLGNIRTPTLNMARGAGKAQSTPTRGAYKCELNNQRGKKLQAVSGRDINTFESADTLFDIEFPVGRVHLGDEWVHQQLEEAGIQIDYAASSQTQMIDTTKEGWWTKGSASFEVLVNLADNKLKSLDLNYVQELNKAFWRSNASEPKLWAGVDSCLSRSSNTSGDIGNRSRAGNELLRHKLTAISQDLDIELDLDDLRYECNKKTSDGTTANYLPCGRNFYNKIKEVYFSGSNTISSSAKKVVRNYDQARSEAQANSAKLGIGFPDEGIYLAGVGTFVVEPVFAELDKEDAPAIPWDDSCFVINLDHFKFMPTAKKDGAKKIHATPYNQNVTRISCYGEYALVLDWIDCHGVAYLA